MGPQFEESPDLAMVTFRNVFRSRYGELPERALFERIIFGHESGMNGFVREAVDTAVQFFAHTHIANRVDQYMDTLSDDEYSAAGDAYVAKWGHLLPSEMISKGSHHYPPALRNVLKQHTELLLRLRSIPK